MVYRGLYSYRQRVRVITLFPNICFRIILSDFGKVFERKSDAYKWLICIMQRVHFQVRVVVFNCQQILVKISFVIFVFVIKKQIECGLAWHWWNSTDLGLIDMVLISLNAEIVACMLAFRKSRHKPNLENTSKYGFSPDLGGKNGGVLSMRMQVILDSSFARPGLAPIWGRKKGEFRDWTSMITDRIALHSVLLPL